MAKSIRTRVEVDGGLITLLLHAPHEGTWRHPMDTKEAERLVQKLNEAVDASRENLKEMTDHA
jgi:hypothetical protein